MNTFQQLVEAAQFQISGGSEYLWRSFGQKARWLDFESKQFKVEMSLVFDAENQEVYQAALYLDDIAFRWNNPVFVEAYKKEAYQRNVDPRAASEDTHFSDCELLEDFVSKVKDSFATGKCDSDIIIPLDLTPEQQELFNKLPEGTNIEEFVLAALTEKLATMSQRHRENWDIVFSTLEQAGITVTIDIDNAPIAEHNIQEVYDWVKSLNVPEVHLFYSDKETEKGIVSLLIVDDAAYPENTFEYLYKKV